MSQNETTDITYIEVPKTKGGIVAEADLSLPTLTSDFRDQADMLANLTQRVKRRMQARNVGRTRNSQRTQQGDREGIAGTKVRGQDEGGFLKPGDDGSMRRVSMGPSMIDARIPGVEFGSFNSLNADQFTYYAFFTRINEQLRNRWTAQLNDYVYSLSQKDMQTLALVERTTQLEVIVSPDGEYVDAVLHQSSGDKVLDEITANSFRLAAPFMNPPRELREEDGYVHLRYSFTVHFRPPSFGPEGS